MEKREKMKRQGDFTLPGEAGYEELTLKLAEKWGADVIRDSDGTVLSKEILNAGYEIYSTICLIRGHNEWAKEHMETVQQTFLMTEPVTAEKDGISIFLMKDFFEEQFKINDTPESLKYWQVFDRTTNREVPKSMWEYKKETQEVAIRGCVPWHQYTVNFLSYRIWEEISMYNHVTNNWEKEHLIPVDPRYPEVQNYLKNWLKDWCKSHPDTDVVRFTSMFYNFVWIWGSKEKNRNRFTDWGSYDFTVSLRALQDFEKIHGFSMKSEDFINQGKFHVTHMPPDKKKRIWMSFIQSFVLDFGRELIDIVHQYGKKAYVFYDDSWVGIEPYNGRFCEFGFDGIIKCVFSGYEVRMCAGVPADTHEIRLHPYLFPVGLGGKPTFTEGGNPEKDVMEYWVSVRRALMRQSVERIGLGGYLHLTEDFPEFQDAVEKIADDFREIRQLHKEGKPYTIPGKVAVLHSWGSMRPWTLSGHFHETYMHDLIHVNEALSGLPLEVEFLNFEEILKCDLQEYKVIINAGREGDAWSGGKNWNDEVTALLTKWVAEGGTFIGINEPSAVPGYHQHFRMAHVLGVDYDKGDYVCHGKKRIWGHLFLTDESSEIQKVQDGKEIYVTHNFGKGKGIYLSFYEYSLQNAEFLFRLICSGCGQPEVINGRYNTECAYFPEARKVIIVNNTEENQKAEVLVFGKKVTAELLPYEQIIKNVE